MQPSARESYLVAEVMTAAPQKLQLLLIETTIRQVQRTKQHWRAGENGSACETLVRAQEILAQILAGLNRDLAPALVAKVTAVYLFVYRNLLEAGLARDEQKLDEALRVLQEERATWRQLCRQLGTPVAGQEESVDPPPPAQQKPPRPAPPMPHLASDPPSTGQYSGGLSLDA